MWQKYFFFSQDDNIDETYGVNVQFEESEDEVSIIPLYKLHFCKKNVCKVCKVNSVLERERERERREREVLLVCDLWEREWLRERKKRGEKEQASNN